MMNYKNHIFILRNIHKSNDEELVRKICTNCNRYHYSCKKPL